MPRCLLVVANKLTDARSIYWQSSDGISSNFESIELQGTGMDLRPMQSIYTYTTLVIFASGKGIGTAKALIEATSDANGLDLGFRQSVRLYYRVSSSISP